MKRRLFGFRIGGYFENEPNGLKRFVVGLLE
jgi:hypothetical protein